MNRIVSLVVVLLLLTPALRAADKLPEPMVTGLEKPESACVGLDGRVYLSIIGGDKDGDGSIAVVTKDGKAETFAKGLDDPKGLASYNKWLFCADKKRVWRIDDKGKAEVYADVKDFPTPPLFLNDVAIDAETGVVYVSDSGDLKGGMGAVYALRPKVKTPLPNKPPSDFTLGKIDTVLDTKKLPALKTPNGLLNDGTSHLLLLDFGSGDLYRIKLADSSTEKIADGFDGGDGLIWDRWGRLYVSSWKTGKVWVIPRPGDKPLLMAEGFKSAADICLDPTNKFILVPDMNAGTLTALPAQVPGAPVDFSPLPVESAVAFPDLKWTGWEPETSTGKPNAFRPILLTHAGDGSNRVFVPSQQGVIHVFPNDQKATRTKIFLDISSRVRYSDAENEEGFLGLAFHPKYKENGEFFVFYTPKNPRGKYENVICRYRVSKDDPDKADPNSEEELLRLSHKFWNHDGGTLCFGKDGYLYIAIGDGGLANDPDENGQNLKTLLGKILRIDIDHKGEGGAKYAIPKDNPFVKTEGARPEIWSLGWRNPWRIAFDRKTGELWAGEVGQNLYEEIDIVKKGGNYGWNIRESLHPFGVKGVGPRENLVEPIWEYHHDVGKSITGGSVYRGTRIPELDGYYLYADYVSGKMWGLKYDEAKGRVTENRPIKDRNLPVMSFGEDEKGEVYYMTYTTTGKGIYWFVKSGATK